MIAVALALAAAAPSELRWTADATVFAGGKTIAIASRTRLRTDGKLVVSESWPAAEGEAKGLRRMTITPEGGTLERGGKVQPLPASMSDEERAQYGFYLQLQDSTAWCAREPVHASSVRRFDGPASTVFRCTNRRVTRAANQAISEGKAVRQDFRIDGLWRSRGMVFPKAMEIRRDGQPYFTMIVTQFDAR